MSGSKARGDFNGSKIQKGGYNRGSPFGILIMLGGHLLQMCPNRSLRVTSFTECFPWGPGELDLQALGIVMVFKEILYILHGGGGGGTALAKSRSELSSALIPYCWSRTHSGIKPLVSNPSCCPGKSRSLSCWVALAALSSGAAPPGTVTIQAHHPGVGPGSAEAQMGIWMGVRREELRPGCIKPTTWQLGCDLLILSLAISL